VRAQCAAQLPSLSSLLHANVRLEGDFDPQLLLLLDGTRDTHTLIQALSSTAEQVDAALARFAALGLLQPPQVGITAANNS
jgi:hypothetical protein